jgi:SAM-dependent methyltransferase
LDFGNLSTKYLGTNASGYEAERAGRKWQSEQAAVEELLAQVPEGSKVLDVPVGTGRLMPFHKARDFDAYGLDVSPDMLAEARAYADAISAKITLSQGDIRQIPFEDDSFDLVACLRFLNWIDQDGVDKAVGELVRVSRKNLLLGIRYLTAFGDLGLSRDDSVRLAMRSIGLPRMRARKWGLVYHDKTFVHGLFARRGLEIVDSRHVERRWDGTDYVFFLLRKR